MKRDNLILAMAIIMIAIVAIGGISIYFINPYSYDADALINADNAEYSLDVSNPIEYNILVLDNFEIPATESLIICSDGSGYSEIVKTQLNIRGFYNVEIVDPKNLLGAMKDPSGSIEDSFGRAILIPYGPFPEEIYSGSAKDDKNDPLLDWLAVGGSVYWFGYMPKDGYTDDYLSPFGLSKESFCTVPDGNVNRSHELCTQLCFRSIDVMHGLRSDIGKPISYVSDSGFSAITVMKVLNGTMVVLGGKQSGENSADLSQVIASGITYGTELIAYESGIVRNTIGDLISYPPSIKENISVYINFGGYYTVYGERFQA